MKACLLILPTSFYFFVRVFSEALAQLGYAVTIANEEYPDNAFGKVIGKLSPPLARRLTRRVFARRFLSGRRWDLIVIIKGRGIGPALVGDMRRTGARIVGYHFDGLNYDRGTRAWGPAVDRVSTFDYRDAHAEGWPVAELFSTLPPPDPLPPIRHRLSAILRNHSHRLAYVDEVFAALGSERGFVYIFEKNLLTAAQNALRSPRLYWRWRRDIHFKPLPYDRYIAALGESDFTIDYAHPKQSGVTMRSFEALAMGVKLITNNHCIARSPHFGPGNAIVFPPGGDTAELREQVDSLGGTRPSTHQRTPLELAREVVGDGTADAAKAG